MSTDLTHWAFKHLGYFSRSTGNLKKNTPAWLVELTCAYCGVDATESIIDIQHNLMRCQGKLVIESALWHMANGKPVDGRGYELGRLLFIPQVAQTAPALIRIEKVWDMRTALIEALRLEIERVIYALTIKYDNSRKDGEVCGP
jgi:hypothetical protein